jgi:CheY-like chemotaxis protein
MPMNRNQNAPVGKPTRALAPIRAQSPRRILVVDDDGAVRKLNASALRQSGYEVEACEDGADAWARLQAASYDLLVTDHAMPKVTGLELLQRVRAAQLPLPVILVSGRMPTAELQRHSWLKLEGKLEKPYSIAALLVTVNDVLGAADAARDQIALTPDRLERFARGDSPE